MNSFTETETEITSATKDFVMQQTMLRIKDPDVSIPFYKNVLGMSLLGKYDFPDMAFSLYFMGYEDCLPDTDEKQKTEWLFRRPALLELTHNWGTEADDDFAGYHNGNESPQGFGHIGISVPDVYAAAERFEKYGVEFVKQPDDGKMKGLAFIQDPDGYWIEILSATGLAKLIHAS